MQLVLLAGRLWASFDAVCGLFGGSLHVGTLTSIVSGLIVVGTMVVVTMVVERIVVANP